ncbi:Oxysterol-binding protein, partial [Ramicandelaber brevisporus]
LRQALPAPVTERPSFSFWAILKNAIGQDLSRISVPVLFNEPTSMLQRMAEDMEFAELLDIAATRSSDSLERTMWVAAWAMSNYSSTEGRVAKPFNPLLGETFEYVRPDREYRYVSEQVSHHPPISACHCDSPRYQFYAEVNVKSKLGLKGFDILPQGVSHVELKVQQPAGDGDSVKVITEHYSWKKVTTTVKGLITGSPWMDHHGDMIVTNHRTGDVVELKFKEPGWLDSSSPQIIEGVAKDGSGRVCWEIYGKWSERLIARRIPGVSPSSSSTSSPSLYSAKGPSSSSPTEALLLWRVPPSQKAGINPNGSHFRVTPFAATLNDLPDKLRPYLCPTDSRFRPDQAMLEIGEYEKASSEKNRVEEKQRTKRKAPEEWKPRWFVKDVEADTNEPYWRFLDQYWKEREDAVGNGGKWSNVDDIY